MSARRKPEALARVLAGPPQGAQAPVAYTMPPPAQEFIKVTMHSERLKFGRTPRQGQLNLFDLLDEDRNKSIEAQELDRTRVREMGISVVGMDLPLSQSKALHAVQTLLSRTDYKGNMAPKVVTDPNNAFVFTGELPLLRCTASEYLDAYGVTKYKTKRGKMEYSSSERSEAVRALDELAHQMVVIVYDRLNRYDAHGKPIFDIIRTVRPLLTIVQHFGDVTEDELEGIKAGDVPGERLRHLIVEPSVVLVDQVNSYFVLKPAGMYEELRTRYGKLDKRMALFLEYLFARAADYARNKRPLVFRVSLKTLAYSLRMDKLIESRQAKRILTTLQDFFAKAQDMGYVGEYTLAPGAKPLDTMVDYTLVPGKVYYPAALQRAHGEPALPPSDEDEPLPGQVAFAPAEKDAGDDRAGSGGA
ncbi:MAG: hypothetical protein LBU67_03400 [Oscillospiraceae bacterium]|nr:hypothetical protein [Oscillospiraceae bacterium]